VLLPCLDVERLVGPCIESLLGQTWRDLEVIAIDDGSTDATQTVLQAYARRDSRLRVLRNRTNRGLIDALNRGVSAARGEFIARMDADSFAMPERIQRQVGALEHRPEIAVVGTGVDFVDEAGKRTVRPRPVRCVEPGGARFMALFANPLAHTTIMARTEVMAAHPYGAAPYSLHTEDYELFTRMLAAGASFLNLPEPLVTVRERASGTSRRNEQLQVANFIAAARQHLKRTLDLELAPGVHKALVNRIDGTVTARDLELGLACLGRLERTALSTERPGAADDIRRVADLQRVDIVMQAALKGDTALRASTARLGVRHVRRLLSGASRRYLASKVCIGSPRGREIAP
jgi:glycosyltransferase involved in cell wall biosynthesis